MTGRLEMAGDFKHCIAEFGRNIHVGSWNMAPHQGLWRVLCLA